MIVESLRSARYSLPTIHDLISPLGFELPLELFATPCNEAELAFNGNPLFNTPEGYFSTQLLKWIKFWQDVSKTSLSSFIGKCKCNREFYIRRLPDGNFYICSIVHRYRHCKCCAIPGCTVAVDSSRKDLYRLLISRRITKPCDTKDKNDQTNDHKKLCSRFHLLQRTLSLI